MRRMFSKKQIEAMVEENPQLVVNALKGQDINVEGITSKGIANTGNIGNTGDIAATGKITGGEIIENMSGYSAEIRPITNITIENVFCGIVKNGNKLTIVHAFNITRNDSEAAGGWMAYYRFPSSVGAKLLPTRIGTYDWLACGKISAFNSVGLTNNKEFAYSLLKASNTETTISCDFDNFTVGVKYYCRIEMTFLLSDNLISEE